MLDKLSFANKKIITTKYILNSYLLNYCNRYLQLNDDIKEIKTKKNLNLLYLKSVLNMKSNQIYYLIKTFIKINTNLAEHLHKRKTKQQKDLERSSFRLLQKVFTTKR